MSRAARSEEDGGRLDPHVVGARIRARRSELGLTLQNVADRTRLSKSFLSQVEIGKSLPSVGALEQISEVLEMPTRAFVADNGDYAPRTGTRPAGGDATAAAQDIPDRRVRITRRDARKTLTYPGGRGPLQLLTPDLQRQFEVTEARDEPGTWHAVDRTGTEHEEFAFVVEGTYEIEINEERHVVQAGDSIYLAPSSGYRFRAVGDVPARAIWIAIPPAF